MDRKIYSEDFLEEVDRLKDDPDYPLINKFFSKIVPNFDDQILMTKLDDQKKIEKDEENFEWLKKELNSN